MEKNIENALRKSIQHWTENVGRAKVNKLSLQNISSFSCSLCKACIADDCSDCPVYEKTNYAICKYSPWGEVAHAIQDDLGPRAILRAVKKELKFLKSLLPKERKRCHVKL